MLFKPRFPPLEIAGPGGRSNRPIGDFCHRGARLTAFRPLHSLHGPSNSAAGRRLFAAGDPISVRLREMASGTVKWFNTAKGFGFIQPDDGGSDVFVHISAVEQAGLRGLNEGDIVSFELEQD